MWSSLVADTRKALSAHLDPILAHLTDCLVGREWRAREASCAALAEILSGRTFDEIGSRLAEIHARLLRALDDIKDSVRRA